MAIKRNMVAGILLTLAVSIVAKLLSPYLPSLGGEALAMLMGIVLGNTLFAHERWNAGVKWAEKYPIEIGIALVRCDFHLATNDGDDSICHVDWWARL